MKKLFITLSFFIFSFFLFAQNNKKSLSDSLINTSSLEAISDTLSTISIFENDTPLVLNLKYDITSFIKNKNEAEYLDAELTIEYPNSPTIVKNIRLKARGNFRRGQCFFPPIRLNFKTDPIENIELKGVRKIKLVTHCSQSKSNEKYILKEYLAYKLYNVLTDKSFRVKLLDITYVDTGKKERNYNQMGFLIEPVELVAKRKESVLIEPTIVKKENVVEEDADRAALFQYMIGNTDWKIKGGHNTKYIKALNVVTTKVEPVPYDFDFSGLVNAYYAHPQSWTSIENVTEREYLGYCRADDDDYLKTIQLFLDKEEEIFATINAFDLLNERDRKTLVKYITDFYNEIKRPKHILSVLKSECRNDF